jgi:glutamine synthetase
MPPANILMSAFGPIYDAPFGTEGDLAVIPDPDTRVFVPFDDVPEHFYLGDVMQLDGSFWSCGPRHVLRRALEDLRAETGLELLAAFEQELTYTGVEDRLGATYALGSFRRQGGFGSALVAALRQAGLTPDSFLPEYGPRQFEFTIAPTRGLRAADEAVIAREMARAVAHRLGHRAIMAPMLAPDGIGNGTHIHFSLVHPDGSPAMTDPAGPRGMTREAASFVAGIVHHLPALTAVTAPSVASYYRLTPGRWAPTWANLGERDRGSALRICPITRPRDAADAARQFNVEFRVTDATACPHLALGAIVHAGVDGIRRGLTLPDVPDRSIWDMTEEARAAAGISRLPATLPEALQLLAATEAAEGWFGRQLLDVYLLLKVGEQRALEGLEPEDICARYAEAY